jgi:large subunit ribosomal protein L17
MRHRKIRGSLGRTSAHRRAMVNNMITSLFVHERIRTTVNKAKVARRAAERMITLAKRNTLHARRLAYRRVRDAEVLQKLFAVLGPRYQDRPGGYTRITRLEPRLGDGAEQAFLELVDRFGAAGPAAEEKPKRKAAKKAPAAEAAAPQAEGPETETDEERAAESESAKPESGDKPAQKAKPKKAPRSRTRKTKGGK